MDSFISQYSHEIMATIQQVLVYIHLFAFSFAIVMIISEDVKILVSRELDVEKLHGLSTKIACLLGVLWFSGIALLAINPGLDFDLIMGDPKLTAKLTIVAILTINGVLLHLFVFPGFKSQAKAKKIIMFSCVLTAISTTSWVFAGLIGAARAIAPMMDYQQYMIIYLVVLSLSLMVAVFVVCPLMRKIINSMDSFGPLDEPEASTSSLSDNITCKD